MRRWSGLLVLGLGWGVACNGTSTGNPMEGPGTAGTAGLGQGMQLLMSEVPRDAAPELSDEDASAFAGDNQAFAFDLYRQLHEPDENLFFSPFSISVALAMTYAGAEASTESEMRDVLHFGLPEPRLHSGFNASLLALQGRASELVEDAEGTGFELSIVNQAFGQIDHPFLDSYLDVLARHYGSGLIGVDFAADPEARRILINDWVSAQTHDRVKDLLPADSLSRLTRLVLTNAIYFKANWATPFKTEDTIDATFQASGGERTVPMMTQTVRANYAQGDGYQAVELPYLSPAVRLLAILPAAGEFETFTSTLASDSLREVQAALSEHTVTVDLPRFQFESENPLKAPLTAMGMRVPFIDGSADFSGMADVSEWPLHVDEVYHKAFIGVDESGTEAAAATAVVINTRDSSPPPAAVRFDRPFVFCIYDEPTGQILFLGQLTDPG